MNIKQEKITYHMNGLWLGLLVFGLVACLGTGWFYYTTSEKNTKKKDRLTRETQQMSKSNMALSNDYSDGKAKKMREDTDRIRDSMMSADDVDTFIASLRPAWTVISRTDDANDEYVHRRYQITRGTVSVSAWTEILALFRRMSEMHSLALTSLDMQTVGDINKRDFSRITFGISIYVRKEG